MADARRKILDASIELVAEQGVRAVSFREAARRVGVSHQTPYHHFGDHRGILAAIAHEGFAALADAMTEAAGAHDDALGALTASGVAYVAFAAHHVGHFRVMFQQPLEADVDASALAEAERTYQLLARLAGAAVEAGHGRGLAPERVASLCWSTVHGLATLLVEGILAHDATASAASREHAARDVVDSLATLLR